MQINVGINEKHRKEIALGLSHFMADTYTLYLKTHQYHWNVTGPMFQTLHLMFEEQYNELWLAIDQIAERIRTLGEYAPGSSREFTQLSVIEEEENVHEAEKMIRTLVQGHESVIRKARELFPLAEEANDQVTLDLLTQRMDVHEKTAWMLRSLLA